MNYLDKSIGEHLSQQSPGNSQYGNVKKQILIFVVLQTAGKVNKELLRKSILMPDLLNIVAKVDLTLIQKLPIADGWFPRRHFFFKFFFF